MNKFLYPRSGKRGHMTDEIRNAYLVVATLIATATYQAALSPPGGLHQTMVGTDSTLSHEAPNLLLNSKPSFGNEEKSSMSDKDFITVSITNMFCFIASTFAIVSLLPRTNIAAWLLLYLSMILLQTSYIFSILVMCPTHLTTVFILVIYGFLEVTFITELPCIFAIVGYHKTQNFTKKVNSLGEHTTIQNRAKNSLAQSIYTLRSKL
ncbi:hypothetical protein CR513_54852, partial [Mucuna pruriens]